MNNEAGKGDKLRKVDGKKYRNNFPENKNKILGKYDIIKKKTKIIYKIK